MRHQLLQSLTHFAQLYYRINLNYLSGRSISLCRAGTCAMRLDQQQPCIGLQTSDNASACRARRPLCRRRPMLQQPATSSFCTSCRPEPAMLRQSWPRGMQSSAPCSRARQTLSSAMPMHSSSSHRSILCWLTAAASMVSSP